GAAGVVAAQPGAGAALAPGLGGTPPAGLCRGAGTVYGDDTEPDVCRDGGAGVGTADSGAHAAGGRRADRAARGAGGGAGNGGDPARQPVGGVEGTSAVAGKPGSPGGRAAVDGVDRRRGAGAAGAALRGTIAGRRGTAGAGR